MYVDTMSGSKESAAPWTFLTNHAHVLMCIAMDPGMRMREMAAAVGITERAVQRIISELEEGGYLERERDGRRNRYSVRPGQPLRHPIERHRKVADILRLVLEDTSPERGSTKVSQSKRPRRAASD